MPPAGTQRAGSAQVMAWNSREPGCLPRAYRRWKPWRMVDSLSGSREQLKVDCPPPRPLAHQQATPLPAGTFCGKAGFAFAEFSVCCSGCCRAGRAGRDADWAPRLSASLVCHLLVWKPGRRRSPPEQIVMAASSTDLSESTQADRPGQPEPLGSTRCSMPASLNDVQEASDTWTTY